MALFAAVRRGLPCLVVAAGLIASGVAAGGAAPPVGGDVPGSIVTDGTFNNGIEQIVGPGTDSNGDSATLLIDASYGERSGDNLYHSFSEFRIGAIDVATFDGPDDIDTIIARDTGGTASGIYGLLRVAIPDADLFLLNPSGVIFGATAQLDLPGSFHVSTADELHFEDGSIWPTGSAGQTAWLSAASPSAFGFTSMDPAGIEIDEMALGGDFLDTLQPGETLSLVAGSVDIAGRGGSHTTLLVEGGTIQMAAVGAGALVPLDLASYDVSGLDENDLGTVTLHDAAIVNVEPSTNDRSGRIVIRGGELVVERDSRVIAANKSSEDAPQTAIDIQVAGSVEISGSSEVISTALSSTGRGGDIRIEAADLTVKTGGIVSARSVGDDPTNGQGGDVLVDVDGLVRLESGGSVTAESGIERVLEVPGLPPIVIRGPGGPGGDVRVSAKRLEIDGGALQASTFGDFQTSDAGDVYVDANEVLITGLGSNIASQGRAADGGSVFIDAGLLEIEDGGLISVSALDSGNAGLIRVEAENVSLDGAVVVEEGGKPQPSGLQSQSTSGASGAAGRIELVVGDTLEIKNGAQISVSSKSVASGPSGSIEIEARRVVMKNALDGILAESFANTDAGNVSINASGKVEIEDSSISTLATLASGGNVSIKAGDAIQVRRRGVDAATPLITAEVAPNQPRAGGSITLEADAIVIDRAGIRASAVDGLGGNIDIVTDGFLVSDGNLQQRAPGFYSSGGKVFVVEDDMDGLGAGASAPVQLASTGAYFDVSGGLESGRFLIRSPDSAVVGNLVSLSEDFLDVAKLQTNECAARRAPVGSLIVTGRDRVPDAPADRLRPLYLLEM